MINLYLHVMRSALLLMFLAIVYAHGSFARQTLSDLADCPSVSADCACGAIDDCFDDLDSYGLPPPGAPVRRPPVVNGHVSIDQPNRTVRYTVTLTEEGISRYGRLESVALPRERGASYVVDVSYTLNGQMIDGFGFLLREYQFTLAADGLSAYLDIPYRLAPPPGADGMFAVAYIARLKVTAENTRDMVRTLRARRGSARSTNEPID